MNIQDLISQIQAAANGTTGNVTINVNLNQPEMVADVDTDDNTPDLPYTDFSVGDEVNVYHLRKDGVTVTHTSGTVVETQGCDDKGWYTRVLGDNGKHYKTGLKYNEARLGSFIAD